MRIAVFGHDASDAMLARRIGAMEELGYKVTAFTMRRDEAKDRGWRNVDLGQTYDARLLHRAFSIQRGIRLSRAHPRLEATDFFWARNLDMLAVAIAARRDVGSHAPVIYETLDIHGALTAGGPKGTLFRSVERRLMKHVDLIVVSAPDFVTEYYDKVHPGHPPTALIENTLVASRTPPRPVVTPRQPGPFRLGWVGILRCERSFQLLQAAANNFNGELDIILHGKPAPATVPDFEARVEATPNMRYEGPYTSPDDLPTIYGELDAVWAAVTSDAHANAQWLLPNRIYEGGYFGVPAIAIKGTATGDFVDRHGTGETIAKPLEETLPQLLTRLIAGKDSSAAREKVLAAPATLFARGTEDLAAALARVAP